MIGKSDFERLWNFIEPNACSTEEELAETLRERGKLIRCHGFQCRHELRVVGILRQT